MEGKTAEKVSPAIGPLVLALAKTFHWAGLYGTNHPILAKRVGEFHAALLAHLSHEPENRLLIGIARDKVLYRNEFLGEEQELVVRLTESLYLRQIATVGFDPAVTTEGLLSLFRYLHESQGNETAVSPEQFLQESGITGISLSPYNYKELLSRKLSDSQAPAQSESREKELWRLLLADDFTNKNVEKEIMEELLHAPALLPAILRRAREAESRQEPASGKAPISGDVLQKVAGRLSMFMKSLPQEKIKQFLHSLESGPGGPEPGGEGESSESDLLLARSLTEGYTDEEFLDLVATLVSVEEKGGARLRAAFAILANERNAGNSLLPRVAERVREKQKVKDYYAQKTWEAVEKLLLSRSEEKYLRDDHLRFIEDISSLRKPYLAKLGKKTPGDLGIHKAFEDREIRGRTLRIFLELLRNEQREEVFFDLLEDIRKAIPNLISLKEFSLLHTILTSLGSLSTTAREEWQTRVRDVIAETDLGQIVDLRLSVEVAAGDIEAIQDLLSGFGAVAAPPLLDRLLLEPEASRRRILIRLLVKLGHVVVPEALDLLSHPKWYFVRNICTILGDIGDRRAVEPLIQATSHFDNRVKREAILAIGKLGAPEAVPGLGRILVEEGLFSSKNDDQTRIDAASALYRIGGTEAIAFLHQGKGARRSAVRSHCDGLLRSLMGAP